MADPYLMNRLGNCSNPYQGTAKKVLCICSAGLLRSPTTAEVLSRAPFNYNTRAVGLEREFALIPVDPVLLAWADEIVCMTENQVPKLKAMMNMAKTPIICLNINDSYPYRDPELKRLIVKKYNEAKDEQ